MDVDPIAVNAWMIEKKNLCVCVWDIQRQCQIRELTMQREKNQKAKYMEEMHANRNETGNECESKANSNRTTY